MKTRTAQTSPRASWREHFLAVARRAGEPVSTPLPAAFGLKPRSRPGLSTFTRRRPALVAAAA